MPRNDLIELRHGTAAAWATANPVLAAGEPGAETDSGKVKVGDGTSVYADLPYVGGGGGGGVTGPAAWFRMTSANVATTVKVFAGFTDMDDGRAPPRPDLIVIDGGDPTTLNVVEAGEYLISLTMAATQAGGVIGTDGFVRLRSNVEINGDNEAPAYYLELTSIFLATDTTVAQANLTFQQTLEAGDTIQVGAKVALLTAITADATWHVAGSVIGLTKIGDLS